MKLLLTLLSYSFYTIGFITLVSVVANIISNNVPQFFSMNTREIFICTFIGIITTLGGKALYDALQEEHKTEQKGS